MMNITTPEILSNSHSIQESWQFIFYLENEELFLLYCDFSWLGELGTLRSSIEMQDDIVLY